MRIDSEDLRRHYASLADEELAAIDAEDLTEAARAVYDAEVARRGLSLGQDEDGPSESAGGAAPLGPQREEDEAAPAFENAEETSEFVIDVGPPPDWLEDAAYACSFVMRPGNPDFPVALKARAILRHSGIPCYITLNQDQDTGNRGQDEDDPPAADPAPQSLVCVMVPGALALHATSILDRDLFNKEKEAEWRNHFEGLSDEELSALDPEMFCAGYLDLVERLKRAYDDEFARRRLIPRTATQVAG